MSWSHRHQVVHRYVWGLRLIFVSREQPQRPSTGHLKTALPQRALVQLPVREAKVVENESNVNKKLLASAAAVCLATNFLTVQGKDPMPRPPQLSK